MLMKNAALMTAGKVYVVVDERTWKFRGVYPSLDTATDATSSWMTGDDDSVIILPFDMYETSLRNKRITIEEIINGKDS